MKNILKIIYFGYLSSVLSVPIVKEKPIDILLEGLAERHSCRYCPSLDECISPEIYCKEYDFPYNILYQESGIIIPEKK